MPYAIPTVFIVDKDDPAREWPESLIRRTVPQPETFASTQELLSRLSPAAKVSALLTKPLRSEEIASRHARALKRSEIRIRTNSRRLS